MSIRIGNDEFMVVGVMEKNWTVFAAKPGNLVSWSHSLLSFVFGGYILRHHHVTTSTQNFEKATGSGTSDFAVAAHLGGIWTRFFSSARTESNGYVAAACSIGVFRRFPYGARHVREVNRAS